MQKTRREALLLIAVIAVVFCMLIGGLPQVVRSEASAKITPVTEGWYILQDGVKTPLELPATVAGTAGEALVLYNDSLTQEQAGMVLSTRGAQHGLEVYMGEELLYRYSDEFFPRNDQMKSKYDCDIPIPANSPVGLLKVQYPKAKSGAYSVSPFYIGSGAAVMWQHLMDASLSIVIAFLFIVLSIIALGIAYYLHRMRIDYKRFFDTAIFLLICSVWLITDTSLIQIQSGNAPFVCVLSFYAFMLLGVPMLYFIRNTKGLTKFRVLEWLIRLFYLNAIVQGLLHLTLDIEFRDMLFVTHLLLAGGVLITCVLFLQEYRRNKSRDVGMILTAYGLLGFSGILSLVLYWVLEIPYYGMIFELGILVFVLFIIANIVMTMGENIHYRTEMQVYQRMLRQDWMTGMENRRPFEDYLAEIQGSPLAHQDAVLIFFNINQLQEINDESGHAAGDELILGAAKCIAATFGDLGRCFRLEGDEFSVILEKLESPMEELFQRFNSEIQKYNRNNQYRLSISRGWSPFYNGDGNCKTISNWKFDATNNLYENKSEEKAL